MSAKEIEQFLKAMPSIWRLQEDVPCREPVGFTVAMDKGIEIMDNLVCVEPLMARNMECSCAQEICSSAYRLKRMITTIGV